MNRHRAEASQVIDEPLLQTADRTTDHTDWTEFVISVRSAMNILDWEDYLPRDCIDTMIMIRMGWDRST